jgi:hypothetical protein
LTPRIWTGSAAEAFQAKYAPQPGKWRDASTASSDAGGALGSHANTVEWAQGQAREAISQYAEGQQATQAAVTAYNNQVAAYNAAAQQYDARLSAAQNPGPRPAEPGAFSDSQTAMSDQFSPITDDGCSHSAMARALAGLVWLVSRMGWLAGG